MGAANKFQLMSCHLTFSQTILMRKKWLKSLSLGSVPPIIVLRKLKKRIPHHNPLKLNLHLKTKTSSQKNRKRKSLK